MTHKFVVVAALAALSTPALADPVKVATLGDFNYADTRIHTYERTMLKKVAKEWKQNSAWATITVEGHGFYTEDEEASISLGQQRAEHARALLIEFGVDPLFVRAIGHARPQPGRDVEVIVNESKL